jgi:peptidyl-dipeptidase Dcp
MRKHVVILTAVAIALGCRAMLAQNSSTFGPSNPFYAPSTLPFHAPPFNRIQDSDYQPALEAGMAQQLRELQKIANNPAPPTFENTLVALEKSGQLLGRVKRVFFAIISANTDPLLQHVRQVEAPKLAAQEDAIYLNPKLFERVAAVYRKRDSLHLDPQSRRLVEVIYKRFVHRGAKLSNADKQKLKKINQELSSLSATFRIRLLAATKDGAYKTADRAALAGLSDAQIEAAADSAKKRERKGYVIPLQNTTQQPDLAFLSNRSTRHALFENSWNRAERGNGDDTRKTIEQMAHLRAQKAALLGFPNYAAWKLDDQMAKTPGAVLRFLDSLIPPATAKAEGEANEIQHVIDSEHGGFKLQPWDWNYYAEKVRKAKYNVDEAQVKPYLELNNVLERGLVYAANRLYGITFHERKDIPVYGPDVRVFEVLDANGKPLALFYCDYFKRDNKEGGAWTDVFVRPSKLMGTLPVVYNVANFAKPAPGQPALISFDDVTTMFHEFGHALASMFTDVEYPSLSHNLPRDFVEFPSQFNEHWATYPAVFEHYARNYRTGAPMPAALAAKVKRAQKFNQGYDLTELLAAAELDMQWHILPASAPLENSDVFEKQVLEKTHLWISYVPPRYRSSYFLHIWGNGYAAGYYGYLWSEMLDDDAFQWFEDHGGLTRANGDRLRHMVLSRGDSADLATMYRRWLGTKPSVGPMLKHWGLKPPGGSK